MSFKITAGAYPSDLLVALEPKRPAGRGIAPRIGRPEPVQPQSDDGVN